MTDQDAGATNTQTPAKPCGRSFNYCLVSKLIVAIPALPITAYIGSLLFDGMMMKMVGSLLAVALVIYAAIKIDQIPALQKKIVKR